MKTCRAPQTRKYWRDMLEHQEDDDVLQSLKYANHGLENHGKTSTRHRHDWTIYRVSCIRELRRRGLYSEPS